MLLFYILFCCKAWHIWHIWQYDTVTHSRFQFVRFIGFTLWLNEPNYILYASALNWLIWWQRHVGGRVRVNPCCAGGTVVTWSRDSLVLSADNVKVLTDSRLSVHYTPHGGANISIRPDTPGYILQSIISN